MTTPTTIKVGPWDIDPGLDFATFKELWPLVPTLGKGIEDGEVMATFVLAAVKRLDPRVDQAEVMRRCKLPELQSGFEAILLASGFRRPGEGKALPAPAGEAPSA